MSHAPRLYLVCYDIADEKPHNKRLRRVYRVMRGYGDHLQDSVFLCILSDLQLAKLKDRLGREIHHGEDQVLFVDLGSADSERSWQATTLGLPLVHPERVVKVF